MLFNYTFPQTFKNRFRKLVRIESYVVYRAYKVISNKQPKVRKLDEQLFLIFISIHPRKRRFSNIEFSAKNLPVKENFFLGNYRLEKGINVKLWSELMT